MGTKQFPQYRRLDGVDHLYRIDGSGHFVELQRIGSRWVRHEVMATMYPEKMRIQEMLDMDGGRYKDMDPSEWSAAEMLVRNS